MHALGMLLRVRKKRLTEVIFHNFELTNSISTWESVEQWSELSELDFSSACPRFNPFNRN
jgi:hypothetical protein